MTDTIVTGASGFIGKHLMSKINATPIDHSLISYGHSWNCDRVFFLSTYGNMAHHADHKMMIQANVRDLLPIVREFTGWFCYMSSSSVMLPVQTPYSRTKRAAEEILQALPELKSCIVRCYSVTGVGEQKEHLVPTLIRSCFTGEPMKLSLKAVHDFIDVEDVVDGLIQLGDRKATGIFELGSGIPTSNGSVWKMVEAIIGKKANVEIVEQLRDYDNLDWFCKNPATGWKPKKTLEMSVSEMVDDYKIK